MGATEPFRARKRASEAAKLGPGASERPQIEPERACSNAKTLHERAKHCDFLKSGCERARQCEKVRVGGAVGALMSEAPGTPSGNIDRDKILQLNIFLTTN